MKKQRCQNFGQIWKKLGKSLCWIFSKCLKTDLQTWFLWRKIQLFSEFFFQFFLWNWVMSKGEKNSDKKETPKKIFLSSHIQDTGIRWTSRWEIFHSKKTFFLFWSNLYDKVLTKTLIISLIFGTFLFDNDKKSSNWKEVWEMERNSFKNESQKSFFLSWICLRNLSDMVSRKN